MDHLRYPQNRNYFSYKYLIKNLFCFVAYLRSARFLFFNALVFFVTNIETRGDVFIINWNLKAINNTLLRNRDSVPYYYFYKQIRT